MQPTITPPSKWSESSLTHQEKNEILLSIVFGEHCVWLALKLFLLIFVQHFSRCMEHALHLAAKHLMEDVAPMPAGKLLTKVKEAMANAAEEDDRVDLDALNIELNSIKVEMSRRV
jgi:hypothetical protein